MRKNKWRNKYPIPVWWMVMSPEYETSYGADYYEPPEWGRDCLWIRTTSAHRAKVLAIRAWRRNWGWHKLGKTIQSNRPYIVLYNDENPMVVIEVVRPVIEMRDLIDYNNW